MRLLRVLAGSAVLVLSLAVAGSCAVDRDPTAPTESVGQPSMLQGALQPTGLLQCDPLPRAVARATIGPEGGTLQVGPHVLTVPARALEEDVTIRGEIVHGEVNAVRFWPEGLTFKRSAALSMSYTNCNTLGLMLPKRIAYTDRSLNILEYLISQDMQRLQRVTGRLDHFSQYAVAW